MTFQRGFDLPSGRRKKGTIPIVSSGGFSGYHDVARAKQPGIVIGRYGSIGNIFYIEEDYWPLNTTLFVKDFKSNYPLFIYYLLHTIRFEEHNGKTGVPGVNRNDLHSICVLLPPFFEQIKISTILSTWDDLLTILIRLIDTKRQQKQALAEQLLTGKRRLKGFEGEWSKMTIAGVAAEFSERGNDTSLTVLSCTKYRGLVRSLEYFGKQIFSEDISKYKLVNRGMLAYATNHIDEGSIGIQDIEDKAVISPMYTVINPKRNIHGEFLISVLKTETYRQFFVTRMSASVDRRGSLRWKDFSKIPFVLPPLVEQKAIVSVLSALDTEIDLLTRQQAKVQEQKRGLMDLLLTGKVRVQIPEEVPA